MQPMRKIPFAVDSALLRELGERLVGKPHIALAELVKNAYDADAHRVLIRFGPDRIEVIDDGHGMDENEFADFWMRIGSPHKQKQGRSRGLQRPLTGSKGIGRLAVQFLASKLELHTVSDRAPDTELIAQVDWEEAVAAGDMVRANALYTQSDPRSTFPDGGRNGTHITLMGLNQDWDASAVEGLAKEIWPLQPPFRANPDLSTGGQRTFVVEVESSDPAAAKRFREQMSAYLNIWHARLVGRLAPAESDDDVPSVRLSLEFADGSRVKETYGLTGCQLQKASFEIRVYHLKYKQRFGIKVDEARKYLNEFGGVHVYDAGFHLPYYGREHDWLDIEFDHSHRLSRSRLLPEELQVSDGMTNLPTQSRLFGIVHVNTTEERSAAEAEGVDRRGQYLKIQVSRDRLVDNRAYTDLKAIVRWAIDFYAMQETTRKLTEKNMARDTEDSQTVFSQFGQALEHYREQIPDDVYSDLCTAFQETVNVSRMESEALSRQAALLGSLATAGMSAVALEHEMNRHSRELTAIAAELGGLETENPDTSARLCELGTRLSAWLDHTKAMRALFAPLAREEDRDRRERLRAKPVVLQVVDQLRSLLRGVRFDTDSLDGALRLPAAAFAEWSSLFQNVLLNATNAMIDSDRREIRVRSCSRGDDRCVVVEDTGCGVDPNDAGELFAPFVRKLTISPDRRALGYGGSGLGLAIVRLIASNAGCQVSFVSPDGDYSTAFRLSWSERR